MKAITPDGVELWFDRVGEGEPLVLTGGFGLLHDQFEHVTPLLARSHEVINWNWRGVGQSERVGAHGVTVDVWARDLETILDAADIQAAYFWSTSVGSFVQTRFAGLNPERVRGLVMYPQVRTEFDRRRRYLLYADVLEVLGWEGLARVFALGLSDEQLNKPESINFTMWERDVLKKNLTAESFRSIIEAVAYADVSGSLPHLANTPVLLLGGDSGPLGFADTVTQGRIDEIRQHIPRVEMCVIPESGGTYAMLEKPDETAKAVMKFLADTTAKSESEAEVAAPH